ncbi:MULTISPECIES: hypothetical protein [Bacillus]|uniref:Uncharacterized protein n=2 Tax=Bacillus TaxID=1386 RepID=A0A0M4G072_9BACI|nr:MULTISPECIES: hypothetical protein [Bacillus]ALC83388.1 hypothetical protein AM592_18910 [Bacillus gobiensis]MBP1082309.1 hypothetical protein [Bacillus capparidis]MED1097431.1 hypothetical protein [Bacillus capparidis]
MFGLIVAALLFNFIVFYTNKRLTKIQIVNIWMFTIAFQYLCDIYIIFKYHRYWYFTKGVDWESLPAITVLIPPVNIMFLSWYPFGKPFYKRILYFVYWVAGTTLYEAVALLPEPWGYFHHGWWNLWYSVLINPILLGIVLIYYKWICYLEKLD